VDNYPLKQSSSPQPISQPAEPSILPLQTNCSLKRLIKLWEINVNEGVDSLKDNIHYYFPDTSVTVKTG
jgi:hypothetical protein